jgi:polysaccharide transporter, PST family
VAQAAGGDTVREGAFKCEDSHTDGGNDHTDRSSTPGTETRLEVLKRLHTVLRHPVSRNALALYSMQMATFIVPLVTLPYVARVLEPSAFGLVVFSQGFAFTLVVLIDWGFGFTGLRSTAESRTNADELSAVVQRVRGAQLLLSTVSIPVALGALLVVPKMTQHPEFLVLAWVAAAATGLNPGWYFVGTEKVPLIAMVQLVLRAVGAVLTFALVKGPGDAWIVMALFAASAVASMAAADVMMYRRVEFRLPRWHLSVKEIRSATMIFVGTIAATLYTAFNVVLLGLFVPSAGVAHFGAAERIVRVAITVFGPIGMVIGPRFIALQAAGDHERARRLLIIAATAAAVPGLLLTGGLALFAPLIIRIIYGHRFVHASVPILRVLVLIIPVNLVGVVFGAWLITLHQDRVVALIVLRAGIANVVLGCVLTPLFGPIGMAWSVIAAEASAAVSGIYTVRRNSRRARVAVLAGSAQPQADPATPT